MVADCFNLKLTFDLAGSPGYHAWGRCLLLVCFFLAGAPLVGQAADVVPEQERDFLMVYAEDFPPFCYQVDGREVGIATELVRELLTRCEMAHRIRIETWKRAYHQTKTVPGHALYSVTRRPGRERDFQWVGPLFADDTIVYTVDAAQPPYPNLDALRQARSIGVLAGGSTESMLKELQFENIEAHRDSLTIYRKLVLGRLHLGIGSAWELRFRATLDNLDISPLRDVFVLNRNEMYLAFHRDTPAALIQRLQKNLDIMKQDGTYQQLVKKYQERPPIPADRR